MATPQYQISKVNASGTENPFLTIITRKYKRPIGFNKQQESLATLIDKDYEQIFIEDNVGYGLHEANKSFALPEVTSLIKGQYVFLLDDDDFITEPDFIGLLKDSLHAWKNKSGHEPATIFFRMTIKNKMNNEYYPTAQTWEKPPQIAHIGGSCFVVRRDAFVKNIHHFGKPRCGDFYFIDAVYNDINNRIEVTGDAGKMNVSYVMGPNAYWLNHKMCETGKVSRGKPE